MKRQKQRALLELIANENIHFLQVAASMLTVFNTSCIFQPQPVNVLLKYLSTFELLAAGRASNPLEP